jgi:hypothetical protein
MVDLSHIMDVLSDPVTDAVARASVARTGYLYSEPVIALRLGDAIRVVVRVSRTRRAIRQTSNRFIIFDDQGAPVWTATFNGISDIAHTLRGDGWRAAKVTAAGASPSLANRLAALL